MTTETKKPAERISELFNELRVTVVREAREMHAQQGSVMSPEAEACAMLNAYDFAIGRYLNEEGERRQRFEAGVLDRLTAIEAVAPPREELDPTKPLYVGDGVPSIRIKREAIGFDPAYAAGQEPTSPCSHCGKPLGASICTTSAAPGKQFCSLDCSQSAYAPDPTEPEQ